VFSSGRSCFSNYICKIVSSIIYYLLIKIVGGYEEAHFHSNYCGMLSVTTYSLKVIEASQTSKKHSCFK
jgi:hypothetical protein